MKQLHGSCHVSCEFHQLINTEAWWCHQLLVGRAISWPNGQAVVCRLFLVGGFFSAYFGTLLLQVIIALILIIRKLCRTVKPPLFNILVDTASRSCNELYTFKVLRDFFRLICEVWTPRNPMTCWKFKWGRNQQIDVFLDPPASVDGIWWYI